MTWDEAYKIAEKYYNEHGDLIVPSGYVSDGLDLYGWLARQRLRHSMCASSDSSAGTEEQKGSKEPQTEERKAGEEPQTEKGKDSEEPLKEEERDSEKPLAEEKDDEKPLAEERRKSEKPLLKERNGRKPLTDEQVSRLESIGMVWNLNDYAWEKSYAVAEAYYKEHGNLLVPLDYTRDGVNLSMWIRSQRQIRLGTQKARKSPMSEEQIRKLDAIGMPWQPYDAKWERSFAVAEKYYREHGNLSVPKHYEMDGVNLSHWIWTQRRIVNGTTGEKGRKLTEEQIRRLESIGMDWAPKSKGFSYYYGLAKRFYEAHGHTDFPEGDVYVDGEQLPESGEKLAAWKREQESEGFMERNGGRACERYRMLTEIGISPAWKMSPWDRNYLVAEQYYREHGDLLVPFAWVTEDGVRLGQWISTQRIRRRGTWGSPLTDEQIKKLDAIGMSWDETGNRGRRKNAAGKPQVEIEKV